MVAEALLVLVRAVVLLVDHDQAEVLDRREQRRARADRDRRGAAAQPLPLLEPLARAQAAVQHRERVAEAAAQPREDLVRERDLGHEHERPPARVERGGDRAQVDLGLAAAGDAVEQERLGLPAPSTAAAIGASAAAWSRVSSTRRVGLERRAEHVARRAARRRTRAKPRCASARSAAAGSEGVRQRALRREPLEQLELARCARERGARRGEIDAGRELRDALLAHARARPLAHLARRDEPVAAQRLERAARRRRRAGARARRARAALRRARRARPRRAGHGAAARRRASARREREAARGERRGARRQRRREREPDRAQHLARRLAQHPEQLRARARAPRRSRPRSRAAAPRGPRARRAPPPRRRACGPRSARERGTPARSPQRKRREWCTRTARRRGPAAPPSPRCRPWAAELRECSRARVGSGRSTCEVTGGVYGARVRRRGPR